MEKSGTFYVKNQDQVVLLKHEFLGQISDGMWENTRPLDHWRAWCNADIKVGENVGRDFYALKDNYNLCSKELLDIVGNRARLYVKIARAFGEDAIEPLHYLFAEDSDDHVFLNQLPSYIANPDPNPEGWAYKIRAKLLTFDFDDVKAEVAAQTYSNKDLLADLREIKAAMKIRLDKKPAAPTPIVTAAPIDLDQSDIVIGSYVRSDRHAAIGRVCQKYRFFSETTKGTAWFDVQVPSLDPMLKHHPWVSVLTLGGDSVLLPISSCEIIEPFNLNNNWEKFYFKD